MGDSAIKYAHAAGALLDAVRKGDPESVGNAVDAILDCAVSKVNANLTSELGQVRALVHASRDETTVVAVKRILRERDGIMAKYRDTEDKLRRAMGKSGEPKDSAQK